MQSGWTLGDRVHRRALRRAVELPCDVITRRVDAPGLGWATDLSPYGMWVETGESAPAGEELVVSFRPPVWWPGGDITVFAQVTRSSAGRDGSQGIGLEFLDLSCHEQRALLSWLRQRPPPLPRRRKRLDYGRWLPAPLGHLVDRA